MADKKSYLKLVVPGFVCFFLQDSIHFRPPDGTISYCYCVFFFFNKMEFAPKKTGCHWTCLFPCYFICHYLFGWYYQSQRYRTDKFSRNKAHLRRTNQGR